MLHNHFGSQEQNAEECTFLPLFALSIGLYLFLATSAVSATAYPLLVPLLTAPCFPSLLFAFIKALKHVKDCRAHIKEKDCKGVRGSFMAY